MIERGPKQPQQAISWIKEAVRQGRYVRTRHFVERMGERGVDLLDVMAVIRRAVRAESYPDLPRHGGSCWRLHGRDPEGRRLAIGVEAYLDEEDRWAVLCTVMIEGKDGR